MLGLDPRADSPLRVAAASVGLFLLTLAVFWPALDNGFVLYDDPVYVTENPRVTSGPTAESLRWAWTTTRPHNWHPLTWMSHQLDWALYGGEARGHHLTSLWIHALTASLLLLSLWALTGELGPSVAVAALFAVHPLRVESVVWIAERKDVLAGLFWTATLLAWAAYARRPGVGRYLVVLALFAGGLLSKPMGVTLPVVLLLLDFWPLRRLGTRLRLRRVARLGLEKVPMLALSAGAALVAVVAQSASGAVSSPPWSMRLAVVATGYVAYLGKLIWPRGLAVLYPYPEAMPGAAAIGGSLALLAGLSALAWWRRRAEPWLVVGWGWYLIALFPVSGVVPVGSQWIADRYSYLPTIGLLIAVGWSVSRFRMPRAALLMLALIACVMVTRHQIGFWRDSGTLFARALAVTGPNPIAHLNLGHHLSTTGELERAVQHYRRSLELRPGQARAHSNLGSVFRRQGRPAEAERELRRALEIDPELVGAHFNLAMVFDDTDRPEAAVRSLLEVVALRPGYGAAWRGLAALAHGKVAPAELRRAVEEARRARPGSEVLRALEARLEGLPVDPEDPAVREGLQGLGASPSG